MPRVPVPDGIRGFGWRSILLVCAAMAAACHPAPPAPPESNTAAAPAPPDQANIFFPAAVNSYGLTLSQTDREHLAELSALRQIDPCGFVEQKPPALRDHPDFSYTYTADRRIEPGFRGPVFPLGGDGCRIAFGHNMTGLLLRVMPGDQRWNADQFGPAHPGVRKSTSWAKCAFWVRLPLTRLAGAPTSMRDPVLQLTAIDATDDVPDLSDTSVCPLAEALADQVAAAVRNTGVPVYGAHSSTAARFLTADPCAAAPDLQAVRVTWREPNPQAQFPTTWRHPGVCSLALTRATGGPDARSAVVKYGLVTWSDQVLEVPWGQDPVRSEQDGVTLFDITTENETGCGTSVIARTAIRIDPVNVGSAPPDLIPPTPVVVVNLRTPPGRPCLAVAKRAALAAVKRAR